MTRLAELRALSNRFCGDGAVWNWEDQRSMLEFYAIVRRVLPELLDVAENIGVTEDISGPSGLYFLDSDKIRAALAKLEKP